MKFILKRIPKILGILTILFLFSGSLMGQNGQLKFLLIGSVVPNIQINNVSNYKNVHFKISDFKGKLVIIDFWNIDCGPCIAAFPHLDSLQQKFGNKIQIILATSASERNLDSIYRLRRKSSVIHRYHPKLISVAGDSILTRLFRFKILPHDVWIGLNGRVRAITEGQFVTSKNIEKMLADSNAILPVKNDFISFKSSKPNFPQIYSASPQNLKYYSVLTKYVPGLWGSQQRFVIDSVDKTVRISRTGSILDFYGDIFSGYRSGNPFKSPFYDYGKRVILKVKDSTHLFYNISEGSIDKWRSINIFQYETVLPLMSEKQAYKYYLADIDKYFDLHAKYVERTVPCMVIERTSNKDRIRYNGHLHSALAGVDRNGTFFIKGASLETLRIDLSKNNISSPYIFINNTNYNQPINIEIHSSLSNIQAVSKELKKKYDLEIKEKNEKVKFLLITQK